MQGKKAIWKAHHSHLPNEREESLERKVSVAPQRNPRIAKDIVAINRERRATMKASKARVQKAKTQAPKTLAKLAKGLRASLHKM